jgi:hypothetical protein
MGVALNATRRGLENALLQGQTKVDEPDLPLVALFADEDVGRLHVAVQDVLLVGGLQRLGNW